MSHPRNAYTYLIDFIQLIFAPAHTDDPKEAAVFQVTFLPYYAPNALQLVKRKLGEKAKYGLDLRALIDAEVESTK